MIISMFILCVFHPDLAGQKFMKIDNELKSGSSPMAATRKGFSSVGRYEFGDYRIVSGKSGWTVSKSTKKFLSWQSKSESKTRSSFVFVAANRDTVHVNLSFNTRMTETEFAQFKILNQSNDNFMAVISPDADTTDWNMFITASSGVRVPGNFQAEGVLTDGSRYIMIREVKTLENGRNALLNSICGYEFVAGNVVLAAVQAGTDTFLKKYVWIGNNTDDNLKSVIGAAAASLLVYTEYMSTEK